MRKQSWEIGGMYASHPKVIIHEVKNNNIDYLTFEILEDGIVTFTSSQETNILSWSFDNGSTWTEGNEIEVKKGDNVKCKGECVQQLDPYGYPLGIGQFSTTCHYNLSGNVATLLKITEKLAEEEIIDNIYAASCGAYTLESSSSGEIFFQTTYPNLSKKERVIALYQHSWEEIHEEFKTICTKTQESLLQESYNLAIQMEEFIQMIPNYAELTPEEFFITFAKMNVPDATDLDGIGVGLYFPLIFNEGSDELECEYYGLFAQNNKLIDASKLTIIPLSTSGCANMFMHCTSLKYPPKLPATTLTEGCYESMFYNCTSLITAPDLPATTLTEGCYNSMFKGCTSLITAPELPATTLAIHCYDGMFRSCTSLTTAPELPATTLANYCYSYMFYGCTSLNHIKMLATDISAEGCLSEWVYNVAKNGTFIKHIDATWDTKVIPTGWNVEYNFIPRKCNKLTITADDVLGRATYTKIYYTAEVEGLLDTGEPHIAICTGTDISKEFAKNMSTTEVVNRSIDYTYMGVAATTTIIQDIYVDICDGYLTINALEDGLIVTLSRNSVEYCIDGDDNWITLASHTETSPINTGQTLSFRGHIVPDPVYGIGTFTINKQCNLTGNCNSLLFGDLAYKNYNLSKYTGAFFRLFYECTSIKNVSSKFLPATTLADSCYRQMFRKCALLTTAPELPATTLAERCYSEMFNHCTSLTTAPDLPAATLTYQCYYDMLYYCTSLNYIKMLATDISAQSCLSSWVVSVASTGTFIKHPDTEIPTGTSGIPEGWEVETIDI